ncbi:MULTISPECIES: DivIVA domain-containing protein [Micromonospora]|uniref:DivIVA domain-containing protein n=1 Tax=Micromonospora TaxID=1873 RepID=UPI0035A25C5B
MTRRRPARHRRGVAPGRPDSAAGTTGAVYRSRNCVPLLPTQVRQWRFGRTRFGRRGLDPAEVRRFVDRVAGELAAAQEAAERARGEAYQVKEALRRWQSEQTRWCDRYALYR